MPKFNRINIVLSHRVHAILSLFSLFFICTPVLSLKKPNIVFILADDMGWNDVGFHGSNQFPTPNIDALAYSGVILNRYYVHSLCTPSRSALMTGKFASNMGMQHNVLLGYEPRGLPLEEKLLPQYLKEIGYSTHAIGKWHLGFYKKEYTPTHRGFDTHFGYWNGLQDYYDHSFVDVNGYWGLDMRRNMEPAFELHGQYSTDLFTNETVHLIKNHDTSNPFFIYLAHAAPHAANFYNVHPVNDELAATFTDISDYERQRYAAIVTKLDDSVGEVVTALKEKGILDNTIIVFSSDNGGAVRGFMDNSASNWPLRGGKWTQYEGGVRGVGVVWTSSITPGVNNKIMHIVDWLPTLLSAAGHPQKIDVINGVDAWSMITKGTASDRKFMVHDIDPIDKTASISFNDWKIIQGESYNYNQCYGPHGRAPKYHYDISAVVNSPTGKILRQFRNSLEEENILSLRSAAEVNCTKETANPCHPKEASCLFNVKDDPCEYNNLAQVYPEVMKMMESQLQMFKELAVPPKNLPVDPASDPKYWNYTWINFGDYPSPIPEQHRSNAINNGRITVYPDTSKSRSAKCDDDIDNWSYCYDE